METGINQRFRAVIDYLKYNKLIYNETDFCKRVGFVKSFLSEMKNGKKKITEQTVMKTVLAFPVINPKWLLDGEGEMLKSESNAQTLFNVTNSGNIVGNNINKSTIDNRHYYSDSPDVLKAQIEVLEERIKEKDSQIKEKDSQIKEKDSQIKELLNILKNK